MVPEAARSLARSIGSRRRTWRVSDWKRVTRERQVDRAALARAPDVHGALRSRPRARTWLVRCAEIPIAEDSSVILIPPAHRDVPGPRAARRSATFLRLVRVVVDARGADETGDRERVGRAEQVRRLRALRPAMQTRAAGLAFVTSRTETAGQRKRLRAARPMLGSWSTRSARHRGRARVAGERGVDVIGREDPGGR